MKPLYKRILLKLSGEGLMGDLAFGMSAEVIARLAQEIKKVADKGVEICLVVGGGNIFRGAKEAAKGMDRSVADQVGMLATIMNALYLQNALEKIGLETKVLSGLDVPTVCETYVYRQAVSYLSQKKVVIFAGGTGNPYFTTDTGAALRASEMKCEALFKATQVDGVYDSDPKKNAQAVRYEKISYDEVIAQRLKVMDITAVALAQENNIPIIVFAQKEPDALMKAVCGEGEFTIIKEEV